MWHVYQHIFIHHHITHRNVITCGEHLLRCGRVEKSRPAPDHLCSAVLSTTSVLQSPERGDDDELATTQRHIPQEKYASVACTYHGKQHVYQADRKLIPVKQWYPNTTEQQSIHSYSGNSRPLKARPLFSSHCSRRKPTGQIRRLHQLWNVMNSTHVIDAVLGCILPDSTPSHRAPPQLCQLHAV